MSIKIPTDYSESADVIKALKEMAESIENDFFKKESDPTVPAYVKNITEENINNWNNKSDFSGDYTDVENKPSINGVELIGNKTASDLGIYEEVIIGSEEPTSEGWKLFVDETEPEPNYATVEYVDEKVYDKNYIDTTIGNIETLLAEV